MTLYLVMMLAIDIGNTNITIGVFEIDADVESPYEAKATWRFATSADRLVDDYGLLLTSLFPLKNISPTKLTSAGICSVVPPLTTTFVDLCNSYFGLEPLVVGAGIKTGIKILYDSPRDVGSDRIADAAAVMKLYGGPAVVVDFGTATVFDAISKTGEYMGGAIAPGITVAADALFHSTAQLRRVQPEWPPAAIGTNTVHALQSGLLLGHAELVKGMVGRFDAELGGGATVVATGGLATLIAKEVKLFDAINPDLTLVGLRIIHDLNT